MSIESKKGKKGPFLWIQANRVMLVNTGSLIGATAVTSGLGFVYWWVAARHYAPEAVGLASASISTMMLLGSIGVFGLGTLLITELPRQPEQSVSLISSSLVVVSGLGGILGALFALFAPYLSAQFEPLRASIFDIVSFAAGVSLTSASLVLDQAMIGLLHGKVQFARNALLSVIKLILLFVAAIYLSQKTSLTIYDAWVVGIALSILIVFIYSLYKKGWQGRAYLPQWKLLRKLGPAAVQHHLLNMTLQVPTQLLPVVVTMMLTVKMNAWFYVSWMIANFVFVIPSSLTIVLHAMNSADYSGLGQRARITMGTALTASLMAVAVLFFGNKQVLGLFGSVYAAQAAPSLRILVLAVFPAIIKNHYISFCRIKDQLARAMFGMVFGGVLELGCAALGAHLMGLTGLCLGWLLAVIVEGSFMLPSVYKVVMFGKTSAIPAALSEDRVEIMPIWQFDTIQMAPVIPHMATHAEPVWLIETAIQRAIIPAPRALHKTSLVSQAGSPAWQASTSIQSATSGPFATSRETSLVSQVGEPIRQVNSSIQPVISLPFSSKPRRPMNSFLPQKDKYNAEAIRDTTEN